MFERQQEIRIVLFLSLHRRRNKNSEDKIEDEFENDVIRRFGENSRK